MKRNLVAAGRLGYSSEIPWEQVYQEIYQAGYKGTPLILDFGSVERYKEELNKANLIPAPGYLEGRFWVLQEREKILTKAREYAKYSQNLGLTEIFIGTLGWDDYTGSRGLTRTTIAGRVTPDDELSVSEWKVFVMTLSQVCEMFVDEGIRPCFHSHAGSVIETIREIEILFNKMKPELLFMGPDTGQLAFGGIQPVKFFEKYFSIIHAVHLKDIVFDKLHEGLSKQWDYNQFVSNGIYTELGQGDIDIKGIIAILNQSNYSGVYVIETDVPTKKTMYKSNLISRKYLREQIGI
jgi:inosose dehydratase